MTLRILNDVHIGAIRSGGTTPSTALELRKKLLVDFEKLLPVGKDLMLLGDLFDKANIPLTDVLETFKILSKWLASNPDNWLFNVAGNHDLSGSSNVLSSFQFLGALLKHSYPDRYMHIEEPSYTPYGYVIPHLRNQGLFDLALEQAPANKVLFVHANFESPFAQHSDQSLNFTHEQVQKAKLVVCAHEHQARSHKNVEIPGNQIASSVSDWLGAKTKRFLTLDETGFYYTDCVNNYEEFIVQDWRDLEDTGHVFVRVEGLASAEQASDVVNAINRFRKKSQALVITNAVKIESDGTTVDFESTLEKVQGFNVMEALRNFLNAEEMKIIESLK